MACCRQQTRYYAVEAIHRCTVFYLHLHSMRWIAFFQPNPKKLSGVLPIEIANDRFMIPELGIGLGLWRGEFQGFERDWLRFLDGAGRWILTPMEMAQQRAERLAELLRSQGIDPDQV